MIGLDQAFQKLYLAYSVNSSFKRCAMLNAIIGAFEVMTLHKIKT